MIHETKMNILQISISISIANCQENIFQYLGILSKYINTTSIVQPNSSMQNSETHKYEITNL